MVTDKGQAFINQIKLKEQENELHKEHEDKKMSKRDEEEEEIDVIAGCVMHKHPSYPEFHAIDKVHQKNISNLK